MDIKQSCCREGFTVIDYNEAINFLLPRHYSGRKPNIKYAFGYYEDGILVSVCTFGKPASNSLCIGICGKEYSSSVYELNRLCSDGMSINLSKFLGMCLREIRKYNLIIVSYADTQMNHNGYIYQATNFIYTGKTKSRTDKYVENGKHSRHYCNDNQNGLRVLRSSKHRYVFFACNKRMRKDCLSKLRYNTEEYPKGDNSNYILGNYIDRIVVKDK